MIEQPELEFLATDKFGIVQTGKRIIPGMMVYYRGSDPPAFKSNITLSALFGQVYYTKAPNYVYIDCPGNELQFTGTTTLVGSFTIGTYIYVPGILSSYVTDLVIHGFTGASASYVSGRITPHADTEGNSEKYRMVYLNTGGALVVCNITTLPVEKRSGWVHLAFTYDAASYLLKTYFDGQHAQTQTLPAWSAAGNTGAYCFSLFYYLLVSIFMLLFLAHVTS